MKMQLVAGARKRTWSISRMWEYLYQIDVRSLAPMIESAFAECFMHVCECLRCLCSIAFIFSAFVLFIFARSQGVIVYDVTWNWKACERKEKRTTTNIIHKINKQNVEKLFCSLYFILRTGFFFANKFNKQKSIWMCRCRRRCCCSCCCLCSSNIYILPSDC